MALTFQDRFKAQLGNAFVELATSFIHTTTPCPVTAEELIDASTGASDRDLLTRAADVSSAFEPGMLKVDFKNMLRDRFGVTAEFSLITQDPVNFFMPYKIAWDMHHPATSKMMAYAQKRMEIGERMAKSRRALLDLMDHCNNFKQLRATLPTIDIVLNQYGTLKAGLAAGTSPRHNVSLPVQLGMELKDTHLVLATMSLVDKREGVDPVRFRFTSSNYDSRL